MNGTKKVINKCLDAWSSLLVGSEMELSPIAEPSKLLSVGYWLVRNFRFGQLGRKQNEVHIYGRNKLKINK